jgi:hypothetical protein
MVNESPAGSYARSRQPTVLPTVRFSPAISVEFTAANTVFTRQPLIAYKSNETGLNEICVQRLPGPAGKWRISTDGVVFPSGAVCSRCAGSAWDVTPDAQRFLARVPTDDVPPIFRSAMADAPRLEERATVLPG